MFSSGIFNYWQNNEFDRIKKLNKKMDQNQVDDPFKSLTNVQLQSAYYFFFFGICVSILSIFIEIYL